MGKDRGIMKEYTTGNDKVDYMAQLEITGNITPQIWYKTITKETGKPHLLAIAILSDIVYWYRPMEIRDEVTGQFLGYKKKFKSDILQRSYDQFAELFGESKRSVTDAVIHLETIGVIKREFRNIGVAGITSTNILFIDFFPEKLYELTYPNIVDNSSSVSTKKDNSEEDEVKNDDDTITMEYFAVAKDTCPEETINAVIFELKKRGNRYLRTIPPTLFLEICKNITKYATPNIVNKAAYVKKCVDNIIAGQKMSRANVAYHIRAENEFLSQGYDVTNWDDFEQKILSN